MSKKLKSLMIKIPLETYQKIKLLGIINDKHMKDIIVDAVNQYEEIPSLKTKMKRLNNKIYRLKYDSYEKDK